MILNFNAEIRNAQVDYLGMGWAWTWVSGESAAEATLVGSWSNVMHLHTANRRLELTTANGRLELKTANERLEI